MRRFLALILVGTLAACHNDRDSQSQPVGVVSTIAMPAVGPFGAKVTPDGSKLFVPLFGDYGAAGPGSTVAVIDTATNAVMTSITVGQRPEDVDFTADGAYAYVTNSDDATVSVINVATLAVIATIPVGMAVDPFFNGTFPYGVTVHNGRAYVFTTGTNSDGTDQNIVVIDANPASGTFNTVVGGITLTGTFTRGAFRGNGELITPRGAAGNNFSAPPEIAIFDAADQYVTSIVVTPASGGFHGAEDVAVTPNGRYAYVPFFNFGTGAAEVFVIDLVNRRFQDVITLANGDIATHGVAMRPDGLLVGATSWNAGTASFIFTPTNTVVYTFPCGANPNEIAFSPDGRRAYVTNQNAQTVTVIALPDSAKLMRDELDRAQMSTAAAADLWPLRQQLWSPNPPIDELAERVRDWAQAGQLTLGDAKNLSAQGAQLNNFAVPLEGVIARP